MTLISPSALPGREMPRVISSGPESVADRNLRRKAAELEAVFLSEMLGHAGLGQSRSDFGGGIGEDQFASFLRDEQARAIVAAGGIGLAERLFRALHAAQREVGNV